MVSFCDRPVYGLGRFLACIVCDVQVSFMGICRGRHYRRRGTSPNFLDNNAAYGTDGNSRFILACIYLTLAAQFVAVIQILVYAGAIMVLFVFVIMLLNLDDKIEYESINRKEAFRISLLGMATILLLYLLSFKNIFNNVAVNPDANPNIGTVEEMSAQLFTNYILPFEVTSILLLSAIIGAVVLAKKRFP